jgi:undecaprenyl-diphosphatase
VKPSAIALAAVLLALTAWRWKRSGWELRSGGLVAVAAIATYGFGVWHPPKLEQALISIGESLGPWTYLLVGVLAFLEVGAFVGLIAPGETVVILGGVIAGQGKIDILPLITLVWLCAVAGDVTSYLLGRRLGRTFLIKHGPKVKMTEERIEAVERFFHRFGGATILVGRFIGLVRAMAPFLAGASKMPFRRFIAPDVVAAGIWSAGFCMLGYVFWQSFNTVVSTAKQGALVFGVLVTAVVGVVAAYRFLREPDNRAKTTAWLDVHPLLGPLWRQIARPVGKRTAPLARWLRDRFTPHGLGLEATSLVAVFLVGAFTFGVLTARIGPLTEVPSDQTMFDLFSHLHSATANGVAKVITAFGSLPVAGTALLVAVALLAGRRVPLDAAALLAGGVLTVIAVNVAKPWEGRPRPTGSLVHTAGDAFPSGHAAYSVFYVAAAGFLWRILGAGRVGRGAFVTAAVVLAAIIGLSRVYLRAHYMSDVWGGWGLAAACCSLCGLVAVVVAFIRQNDEPAADAAEPVP